MKLSEKGLGKLYNSKACYYDPDTEDEVVALSYFEHVFEFEPDDFEPEPKKEPTVELTLDEAKALLGRVPMFEMSADWMHPIEVLKAKIEKAESK